MIFLDSGEVLQIGIVIGLLVLSAVFSLAETAMADVSKIRIRGLAEAGDKQAQMLMKVFERHGKMINTILICDTAANLAAAILMTLLVTTHFGRQYVWAGAVPAAFLVLILGEIAPKTAAALYAEKLSLALAKPVYGLMVLFTPVLFLVEKLSNLVLLLFRINPKKKPEAITEEDLRTIVEVGHEEGVIESDEKKMIYNVFDFGDSVAKDIMVPRTDMACIDAEATYEEFMEVVHSIQPSDDLTQQGVLEFPMTEEQKLKEERDREMLNELIGRVKAAQVKYAEYTQEQVDKIFFAAAVAANKMRIPLAKMAVEETGMGVVEDKVIKNHYASEYIYNAYKDTKTCGVIERDEGFGLTRIAEPIGVLAAVIPTTNPTSTAIFKSLICLKTRNGLIISPHPRAKKCTIEAAKVVLEAAVAAGAPEDIIGWIDQPTVPLSGMIMREADMILATGGPGMVKAAYSSGKPALGVGAGNTPAIIDSSADIKLAASSILHSKTFDNGMICASEQSTIVLADVYDAFKKEMQLRGAYFLTPEETEKVRKTIIINGALNAKIVGQSACTIAELSGFKAPAGSKVLVGEVESVELSEEFAHEKLSPVLAMYKAETFEEAVAKADRLIKDGGLGHTSSLYINVETGADKIAYFRSIMKTCRIVINTPSSQGGIGDLYNFKMPPSLTLAPHQYQDRCREEGKYALVQSTRKGLLQARLPRRRLKRTWPSGL